MRPLALAGLPLLVACASAPPSPTPAHARHVALHSAYRDAGGAEASGLTPEDVINIDRNCLLGAPRRTSAWNGGRTQILTNRGYALEHSSTDRNPMWVCESLEQPELTGS